MASPASPQSEFLRGIKECPLTLISLLLWVLIFGVQDGQEGTGWLEILLMTGMSFVGGSEFATVNLQTNPLPALLITTVALMINSYHILMGAALAPCLKGVPLKKALPALFFMCGENWAMRLAEAQKRKPLRLPAFNMPYYTGVCFILYTTWIGFAAVDAAVGPIFDDVAARGFGMAFPTVFLVLPRNMWKSFTTVRPWFVSLIVAAMTYLSTEDAWYVPAGTLTGLMTTHFRGEQK